MSQIGDYLQKVRQEQQISIRRLATLTDISHSEINKIENGERTNPSPLNLKSIAKVLGINQIECFKIAGYIDPEEQSLDNYFSDFSSEETEQIKAYAKFIHSQQKNEPKEDSMIMKNGLKGLMTVQIS